MTISLRPTPLAIAVALVAGALVAPASAHAATSLVAHAGGGDAAWYTVGLAAQPAPVADPAHAIDVPAGACFTAPCVEVTIDTSDSPWPGGTEWTGRTAFATLDADGRPIDDPAVAIVGTGIAQSRTVEHVRLFDDVRYRIGNRGPRAAKVNVWAQLAKPAYQVYAVRQAGADSVAVAQGFSLMPYTGRIATTDATVWPTAATTTSTDARTGVTTVRIPLDRPTAVAEATFGRLDQAHQWLYDGEGVVALPTSFGGARLVNRHSGLCLGIDNSGSPYGARASLATCDSAASRTWYVANGGGTQRILAAGASGYCLDLPGETRAYGAQATTGPCTGHDSQRWVTTIDNSAWALARTTMPTTLVNANSGFCLDVEGHGTTVGSRVTQGTCNGHASQVWTLQGSWY